MARLTLEQCAKFKLLVRILGLPKPCIRGLLETFWDVANATGDPRFESEEAIEAAAEWYGDPGKFSEALIRGRWVDRVESGFVIHDYWHHCPDYVQKRKYMEERRKAAREMAAKAESGKGEDAPAKDEVPKNSEQFPTVPNCYPPPTPAPAHHEKENPPPTPPGEPDGFGAFWKAYPKKVGKGAALSAWRRVRPSGTLADLIVAAVEKQKGWSQWTKDGGQYIPNPATWLNQGRWEDEEVKDSGSGTGRKPATAGMQNSRVGATRCPDCGNCCTYAAEGAFCPSCGTYPYSEEATRARDKARKVAYDQEPRRDFSKPIAFPFGKGGA